MATMAPQSFNSSLNITHIGTATAIIDIDGVKFITDPYFSPSGTESETQGIPLKNRHNPALGLQDLPPIDAVLLSHEDHPDNLDELGRRLLDGRHVLTTMDGAKNLAPRPGVRGLKPWETVTLDVGGRSFKVTGTPCQHLPPGECVGFLVTTDSFGSNPDGRPNAIYFSGDTVYLDELAQEIPKKFHVVAALLNLGCAKVPLPTGEVIQITMDGAQGARLFREIKADFLVPMHFDDWGHFTEYFDKLKQVFEQEGIQDKVCWLTPGKPRKVV